MCMSLLLCIGSPEICIFFSPPSNLPTKTKQNKTKQNKKQTKKKTQVQPCEKFGHRYFAFDFSPLPNNPGLLKDMGKAEVKGKVGEYIGS